MISQCFIFYIENCKNICNKNFVFLKYIFLFQDAYSSDTYDGSDWNDICAHVGLDLDTDGSTKGNELNESEYEELLKESENEIEVSEEKTEDEKTHCRRELRAKMKELRKILKTSRQELSKNGNEEYLYDMYKNYKNCARSVKKHFKKIFEKEDITSEDVPNVEIEEPTLEITEKVRSKNSEVHSPVPSTSGVITRGALLHIGSGGETNFYKKTVDDAPMSTHSMKKGGKITQRDDVKIAGQNSRGRKWRLDGLPTSFTFNGQIRHKCYTCDFVGRSFGKVYSHMVKEHGAKSLSCRKCSFKTANPTSLHNHNKLYCSKRDRE